MWIWALGLAAAADQLEYTLFKKPGGEEVARGRIELVADDISDVQFPKNGSWQVQVNVDGHTVGPEGSAYLVRGTARVGGKERTFSHTITCPPGESREVVDEGTPSLWFRLQVAEAPAAAEPTAETATTEAPAEPPPAEPPPAEPPVEPAPAP